MELSDAIEIPRVNGVFMRKGPRPAQENFSVPSLQLLHRAVDRVLCEPLSKDQPSKGGVLVLKCKNFMIFIVIIHAIIVYCLFIQIIVFEVPNWEECSAAARSIETLSNINGCSHDYPFYYRCPFQVLDDGWKAFDSEEEFARLIVRCGDAFRISSVNEGFTVSLCIRLCLSHD
ncbi:hypothetical protein OESDEN_00209 [Oesophagostomum dentatum]|uniref:Myotubularin phosphatase domain-containing protein n=1 Tax=Oesophagostomum dentatum TaxID=61180 RepID=A0A0B1TQI7_OESDE|nr:hypothetical protein OESDEN_00209 [Oesophagostomum dentatum]